MTANGRILFLMHISWSWIKQRPHFIAEGLSKYGEVYVLYKSRPTLARNIIRGSLTIAPLRKFPLKFIKLVSVLNGWIMKRQILTQLKKSGTLWCSVPFPFLEYAVNEAKERGIKVIYDCMDDLLAFNSDPITREQTFKQEKYLAENADLIFCSATHLKDVITGRYSIKSRVVVLNNAIHRYADTTIMPALNDAVSAYLKDKAKKIVYLGTVSEWFDFGLCREIAVKYPDVAVYVFGPVSKSIKTSEHSGYVKFCGPVPHELVREIMQNSDILIMPFILNELIMSVNPVKLYEYISSGKPCIAPLYGESVQFNDFCHLYETNEECLKIIDDIFSGRDTVTKPLDYCSKFAEENTWEKRIERIQEEISEIQ